MKAKSPLTEKIYNSGKQIRDLLFYPLVRILSFFKITPNILTYLSILLMIVFVFILEEHIYWAGALIIISLVLDFIDGPLARYQKKASSLGKFTDLFADNSRFVIFIIALVYIGLVDSLLGFIFAYLIISVFVLHSVDVILAIGSIKKFATKGGFLGLASTIIGLSYLLFFIYVFAKVNIFDMAFKIFSIVLLLDLIIKFIKMNMQNK